MDENRTVSIPSLSDRPELHRALERRVFGAASFLGAPVQGPHGETICVLAAMTPAPHVWDRRDIRNIGGYAQLMSDQILLRAALQTVKLMAQERQKPRMVFQS